MGNYDRMRRVGEKLNISDEEDRKKRLGHVDGFGEERLTERA